MKRLENIYEITKRLCGVIDPVGDSNIDKTRLDNLEDTIDLVEKLTRDIIYVSKHKVSMYHSEKAIGLRADSFINEMRENVSNGRTFNENEISQLQCKVHAITGDGEVMELFNELLGVKAS